MVFCHNAKRVALKGKIMGAWGTGPYENDDAGDWKDTLTRNTKPAVFAKLFQQASRPTGAFSHYLEARAAARMLVEHRIGGELNALAIKALERMANDESWLEEWNEPEEVRQKILVEITDLLRCR